jgi:hypothetical protein
VSQYLELECFHAVFSSHQRLAHVVRARFSIHYCIANQMPANLREKIFTQFASRKKIDAPSFTPYSDGSHNHR